MPTNDGLFRDLSALNVFLVRSHKFSKPLKTVYKIHIGDILQVCSFCKHDFTPTYAYSRLWQIATVATKDMFINQCDCRIARKVLE